MRVNTGEGGKASFSITITFKYKHKHDITVQYKYCNYFHSNNIKPKTKQKSGICKPVNLKNYYNGMQGIHKKHN